MSILSRVKSIASSTITTIKDRARDLETTGEAIAYIDHYDGYVHEFEEQYCPDTGMSIYECECMACIQDKTGAPGAPVLL